MELVELQPKISANETNNKLIELFTTAVCVCVLL